MANTLQNLNGVRNVFGPREPAKGLTSRGTAFRPEYAIVDFAYDSLPTNSTTDEGVLVIPANSLIVSARLSVQTAFAGGTSYDIGLVQRDGTAIDTDGFHAATLLAAINAAGKWVVGAGALVGATTGAADAQVKVTAAGTFTAGKARLIVEYIPFVDAK